MLRSGSILAIEGLNTIRAERVYSSYAPRYLTAQNRRQPHHQMSAVVDIPYSSQMRESSSMEELFCKLPQQTEAEIAGAEITVIYIANIRSKYAGKAKRGRGGWKKLIKGRIAEGKIEGRENY